MKKILNSIKDSKNKKKIVTSLLVVLMIFFTILIFLQYKQYKKAKLWSEAYYQYDDIQKQCTQVGATQNYIYIQRGISSKKDGSPEGAIWQVTDINGNVIGNIKTDKHGRGGLVRTRIWRILY